MVVAFEAAVASGVNVRAVAAGDVDFFVCFNCLVGSVAVATDFVCAAVDRVSCVYYTAESPSL